MSGLVYTGYSTEHFIQDLEASGGQSPASIGFLLLTVDIRIGRLARPEQLPLPIPPNTQQQLLVRQSGLGDGLCRLTAYRPLSFPADVGVWDTFLCLC